MAGSSDISKRAEIVRNWEDFLNKYLSLCLSDEYDEVKNPNGFINLGTAVNNMCQDIILPKLTGSDVWKCEKSFLMHYHHGYGTSRLRENFAVIMNEFLKSFCPVKPSNLFFVPGVTGCLDILSHCIADPGEFILAPTPIYGRIYTDLKQRSGVNVWPIPIISEDNKEDFPVLTIEKVKQAYKAAVAQKHVVRGILLINPSNPLGDIYKAELLMDILSFCNDHDLHAIIDEVYALSVYEKDDFQSVLQFEELPCRDRTHVLYGLSKDFGVAGLRIGVIHTENEVLQNCLKELSFLNTICFPIMEIAANFIQDIKWCKDYVSANQERLRKKFNHCYERIKSMGLNVRKSEAAFFLWVDFRKVCGSESFKQETDFFEHLIEEAKLYIVPGKELYCSQPGWFRLTFSGQPDHVDAGLDRLEKALNTYEYQKCRTSEKQ